MKLGVIGTGYVGLVTGTCFAEMGNDVVCVDVDAEKVAQLRAGRVPIFEPGLEIFFERNIREGRLRFTLDLKEAALGCNVIFLALPTPPREDGSADLSYVLGVADEIAALLRDAPSPAYKILVTKSTVPVGTADRVRETLMAGGLVPGTDFDVVSNPEFLREGAAVEDFMKPDRVVIGTSSAKAAETMVLIYEPFVRQGNPIMVMDERSAELTKYAANAFLATKITFMNEIANLCERVGANVDHIRTGIGTDHRIGKHFLYAGVGFGGSCFPKDIHALKHTAEEYAYDFRILSAVTEVNERQRSIPADRARAYFTQDDPALLASGQPLAGRTIAVWGLSFKPNTDDVREAPSHVVIQRLLADGAQVRAFDPEAIDAMRQTLGDRIGYARDMYEALRDADALVVCTEWHEFRRPDFERMKQYMKRPVIFDGRNVYDPKRMAEIGFDYFSVGRPRVPVRDRVPQPAS